MNFPLFKKSRPTPLVPPRITARRAKSDALPYGRFSQPVSPRPTVNSNLFTTTLDGQSFVWMGTNRAEFYRYLRDHVPIISSAIWSWVHLCATPQSYAMEGPENEKEQAQKILAALDERIFENPLVRRSGLKQLTEQFFLELFTVGSFAGEIIPLADGSGIDYFHTLDPDLIQWERDGKWRAYIVEERAGFADSTRPYNGEEKRIYLNPEKFFFAALGADITNPRGIEPLASIPFVAQIQEAMLSDMSRSAGNAGTPQSQPSRLQWR